MFFLFFILMTSMVHAEGFHVQAHRGACAEQMENTLPAFARAIEVGADSIELDVHLTKDGELVVYHDFALNPKFTTLADGTRLPRPVLVHELTTAQLKSVDVLETTRLRTPNTLTAKERKIPTLEEVFSLFNQSPLPHAARMTIDIEVKSDPAHPRYAASPREMAEKLLSAISAHWDFDRVVVRSFDHRVLREARKLNPDLRIAALTDRHYVNYRRLADSLRPNIIAPPSTYSLYSFWTTQIHHRGIHIMPYTVNDPTEWGRLIALGVDGITTDDPRGLITYLEKRKLRQLPLVDFKRQVYQEESQKSFWGWFRK
jgi:glycerophosphoryl diester phosphodiesterase